MTLTHYIGISVLILALGVELLGVWLLPRLGVPDPTGGLLAAALSGALVGGLAVWVVTRPRRR
jgi:hypothetical protein